MEYLNWLYENLDNLLEVAVSVIAAASLVAALTPSPKDDAGVETANSWLAKVRVVINLLALNVKNAKPKE